MASKKQLMEPEEAQWKLERELVKKGFAMNGQWTSRYHKEERILVMSRNLKDYHEHVRAILWLEGTKWIGGVSILTELYGEYLLTYGEVLSQGDSYSPQTHKLLKKRVDKLMPKMLEWRYKSIEFFKDKGMEALIMLALDMLRRKEVTRAISALLTAVRGEISHSTISEALEIIQMKYGRTIKEYADIAQIWEKVFK